jgi:hypothetical protein
VFAEAALGMRVRRRLPGAAALADPLGDLGPLTFKTIANDLRISCKRLARSCGNLTFRRPPSVGGGAWSFAQ